MTESQDNQSTLPESDAEESAVERRDLLTKLVAAAAFAATGLAAGGAGAEPAKAAAAAVKLDKTDKWLESSKIYKDSAFKFHKMQTGFRVEIQAPAELATTLRSMGLVPNAEGGAVKLSIEFTNT